MCLDREQVWKPESFKVELGVLIRLEENFSAVRRGWRDVPGGLYESARKRGGVKKPEGRGVASPVAGGCVVDGGGRLNSSMSQPGIPEHECRAEKGNKNPWDSLEPLLDAYFLFLFCMGVQ